MATRKKFIKEAEVLKALGHPARLKLVYILYKGPRCVCELNEFVDLDQPLLSRHLKILKNAGICNSKKDGMQVIYSVIKSSLLDGILVSL